MSFSSSRSRWIRVLAVPGVAAVLIGTMAGCGSDSGKQSNGSLITPGAQGTLSDNGGARRLTGDRSAALRDSINDKQAKNVILLIGDGMGDSEITVARNVAEGAGGYFKGIDALPLTGSYTHYSLDKKTGKPDYVTDSAASGSAWATGTKTYNGAIGVDIKGAPQTNLVEIAKANGKATGNVTTAEIQDATPAVLGAHVTDRKCYGPDETSTKCPTNALEQGGLGSISEQLLATRADVTLGGGAKSFEQKAKAGEYQGKTLLEQAKSRGYNVVSDRAGLDAVTKADQTAPVLGLFSPGNMPVRWAGEKAVRDGLNLPAQTCKDNPDRPATLPDLAGMTRKAIDLLKDRKDGFFLQVEGASIDKQDHNANPCGQVGETVDLDAAVQAALEFAKADGNTLVIVTADHAHSSQIVPLETKSASLMSKVVTKDGAEIGISYGTSEEAGSQEHTGTQLRVAAYGPRAANVVGLTDQTDLFFTMTDALGLDRSKKLAAAK
ncbi:alkaline phosphatase [Nocardia sp. CDC159]|uniref:Alkaline phosphatase n=1 Tax=Nocardia pulmonis TaxID=2951408 RepID=A0A9X2EBN4_9NOCA|nr:MULTISPECIES: alkaline phosphatase [Nocardia]MCM6777959.1 alkaline phosphatase [Nocardia pulmonis]MCM6790870.1 alkaline phosphatase [Nocardia sp. CDC159]